MFEFIKCMVHTFICIKCLKHFCNSWTEMQRLIKEVKRIQKIWNELFCKSWIGRNENRYVEYEYTSIES